MESRKQMPTNEPVKGASNPTSTSWKSRGIFGNRRRRSRRHLKEERNDKSDTSQKVEDGQHDREKLRRDSATCSTPCDIIINVPASIRISNTANTSNLQISLDTFLRDVQALLLSPEMSRLVHSSSHLLSTAAEAAFHVSLLPVTIPMNVAQSATSAVVNTVGQSCDMVGAVLSGAVPMAVGVTETIASSVVGMVCPMFGFNQSNGQIMLSEEENESCSTTQCSQTASTRSHSGGEVSCGASVSDTCISTSSLAASASTSTSLSQDDLTMFYSFSPEKEKTDEGSSPTSSQSLASPSRKLRRGVSSFMRICDLQLENDFLEIHPDFPPDQDALSASAIDALTAKGFALATHDNLCSNNNPQLPRWQPEGSTTRLLKRASESAHFTRILEKEVLLWHARMDSSIQYGLNVPIFKSRGIVNMDPKSFTELLMDSDRVQTYNRYSGGRTDEVVLQRGVESHSRDFGVGETKIVRSENKIPFASNSVVLWNLMHARRLEGCDDESYIIVSRSVSRTGRGAQDQISEIVWGVNVLNGVKGHPGKTDLTCVSQVGQTMVPGFVQHKLALAALCEVYKSTRALCK